MTRTGEEARAMIRRPDGAEEVVAARSVVGADGASSRVRHVLGFEGNAYERTFSLVDVGIEWGLGRDKVHLDLVAERFYGFFPMHAASG